jgi:hypothetical protein
MHLSGYPDLSYKFKYLKNRSKGYEIPFILITDYVTKKSANELGTLGVNYIDASGNTNIRHDGLYVQIQGKKRGSKSKTTRSRAFQEVGLKVLFYIMSNPNHINRSYREIAESVEVSLGSMSYIMSELEELNFLMKSGTKRWLRDKDVLLKRWVTAYGETLRPKLMRRQMRFASADAQSEWKNHSTHGQQGIYWSGEPAASILTENLRPEQFTLFTSSELSHIAKELKLIPDEKGEVEVLQKFWTFGDDEVNVVPPLLVYADLMITGLGRNMEMAEQIRKNELPHL